MRRVVITGMGAVTPYGRGVSALVQGLLEGRSAVRQMPELAEIGGLRTRVAATVEHVDGKEIARKFRRSMSAMSIFATLAAQEALTQAGVSRDRWTSDRTGISIGSTVGSTQATEAFFRDYFRDNSLERMKSTVFFQIMNHSCASNVAQALEITGRILAPASACATGCQAVGFGFEQIASGKQDLMLCGGADEFHPLTAGTFDVINAASFNFNESPEKTPRPFDLSRDGIVCSEGAGILLLESFDSARERGATILGEVCGFATISDPSNIANPSSDAMERCVRRVLEDAEMPAECVGYINAHATGTQLGDIAEIEAVARIFREDTPISSLKGHFGHAMAASGSLELIASVEMFRLNTLIPTLNLENVDPECSGLRHLQSVENTVVDVIVKSSFALGGVNSSIIVRRCENG